MLAQIIMACVPQDGEYIVSQRSSRVGCCLAVRRCLSIGQLTVDMERKGARAPQHFSVFLFT
jgi:hypothetical protein